MDPSAQIILAGLFQNPRIKNGITSERYLTGLYRLKAKKLFDAVAVHPYSTTPGRVLKAVTQTRLLMNRFKDSRTPIWLTEVGWATGGRKTPLTVSFGKQANNLVRTYKLAASKRKSLGIEAVFWYSLKDVPGSSNLWVDHAGLLTSGGEPEALLERLRRANRRDALASNRGSASGHRRQDHDRVGFRGRRLEPVEHPNVLIVEIDVDVAVELALGREQLF